MPEKSTSIRVSASLISIIALLVTQLIIFSFGYGSLRQQVATQNEVIKENRDTQAQLLTQISTLDDRLIRLEILLSQHIQP